MAITFVLLLIVMAVITALKPLKEPKVMPVNKDFDMRSSPALKGLCVLVIAITLVLYIIFW
jgi:SSS family solute:Na+ symporter